MNSKIAGRVLVLASLAFPLFTQAAEARPYDGDINGYQNYLKDRIKDGDRSGRLTQSERSRLDSYSDTIDQIEKQSRRGGLSGFEKQNLWQQLEGLDRSITSELRDGERDNWNKKGWNNDKGDQGWHKGWYKENKKDNRYYTQPIGKFSWDPYNNRLRKINEKIRDGVESGRLDPNEASYCDSEYYKARALLDKWTRSDGFLSDDEKNSFDRMIDRLNDSVDDRLNNRNGVAQGGRWQPLKNAIGGWNQTSIASNNQGGAQPLWYCSADGGYYDANKTVPGTVWGTELYRYGGTMSDGRPAPSNNAVRVNHVGQIIW